MRDFLCEGYDKLYGFLGYADICDSYWGMSRAAKAVLEFPSI